MQVGSRPWPAFCVLTLRGKHSPGPGPSAPAASVGARELELWQVCLASLGPGSRALPSGAAPLLRDSYCRSLLRGPVGKCADPRPSSPAARTLPGQEALSRPRSRCSRMGGEASSGSGAQCARRAAGEATLWGTVCPPDLSGHCSPSPSGALVCPPSGWPCFSQRTARSATVISKHWL